MDARNASKRRGGGHEGMGYRRKDRAKKVRGILSGEKEVTEVAGEGISHAKGTSAH